jgi:hypothetical protein
MSDQQRVTDTIEDIELRRLKLVERKLQLEGWLSKLSSQISDAIAARRRGKELPPGAFATLHHDQEKARIELRTVSVELSRLKYEHRCKLYERKKQQQPNGGDRHKRAGSFEKVFVDIAKETLATPLFDAIAAATVHRISAQPETEGKA